MYFSGLGRGIGGVLPNIISKGDSPVIALGLQLYAYVTYGRYFTHALSGVTLSSLLIVVSKSEVYNLLEAILTAASACPLACGL